MLYTTISNLCEIINGLNTRCHPMNVYVPAVSSQLAKRSFQYVGAMSWNNLPSFLKDIHNYTDFRFKLKQHILM